MLIRKDFSFETQLLRFHAAESANCFEAKKGAAMTKPADVTAKAREQELKAREFRKHGEWAERIPNGYPVGESRWEDRFAAAYAASAIKEAREECARAMCGYCSQDCAETRQYHPEVTGKDFIHERRGWTNSGVTCVAAAIRALGER
jgi:hypothetical protein